VLHGPGRYNSIVDICDTNQGLIKPVFPRLFQRIAQLDSLFTHQPPRHDNLLTAKTPRTNNLFTSGASAHNNRSY
jgi:hypothetical protein